MKQKVAMALLWAKIGVFSVVALYGLLLVGFNYRATIEPGLRLPLLLAFEKPNAIAALLLTGFVSVGLFWLIGSFYRAVRDLKSLKEQDRLLQSQKELDDIRSRTAASVSPAGVVPDGPIPLEDEEPPASPSEAPPAAPKL